VPSKNFFIGIPHLSRCHTNPNNVASIWLLRGNAGAVMAGNCDGAATTAICSRRRTIFSIFLSGKRVSSSYALAKAVTAQVQPLAEK
jgi:hypothetical protein